MDLVSLFYCVLSFAWYSGIWYNI